MNCVSLGFRHRGRCRTGRRCRPPPVTGLAGVRPLTTPPTGEPGRTRARSLGTTGGETRTTTASVSKETVATTGESLAQTDGGREETAATSAAVAPQDQTGKLCGIHPCLLIVTPPCALSLFATCHPTSAQLNVCLVDRVACSHSWCARAHDHRRWRLGGLWALVAPLPFECIHL